MNKNPRICIAIDGPAASGKSTTAKLLAKKLGYIHIDTGAMYRAITYKALQNHIAVIDEDRLAKLARSCVLSFKHENDGQRILLDGVDVTAEIRSPEVTNNVSAVSSYPKVREVLVELQRSLASEGGVVLEGRDIGTVVLPDAEVKIFLVADVVERAKRRKRDMVNAGISVEDEQIQQELIERDRKDSSRTASPLKKADDAIIIDTTNLTIDEQVEKIYNYVQMKIAGKS